MEKTGDKLGVAGTYNGDLHFLLINHDEPRYVRIRSRSNLARLWNRPTNSAVPPPVWTTGDRHAYAHGARRIVPGVLLTLWKRSEIWRRVRLELKPSLVTESTEITDQRLNRNKVDAFWADGLSDSQCVGMAAPRPIKGILKNKNSGTNVKKLPDDVPIENPEQVPGLSEEDQQ